MKKIAKHFALAVLPAVLLAPSAHAGIFDYDPAPGGFYASGFVGISLPSDADFEGVQAPAAGVPGVAGAPANVEADLDSDVYFGGAIGAKLPFKYWKYFHPRLELEVSHTSNDVASGNFNGGNQTFSGDQSVTYYLINNSSDIIWKENQKIVPYFGGGIGIADFDSDIQYFPNNGAFTSPNFAVRNSDSGFATVSTLGATLKTSNKLDFYVEGRYIKTYGIDAERTFIANGANGFNASVDDDPDGFTFTVGSRLNF